jgi:hypothetical protein
MKMKKNFRRLIKLRKRKLKDYFKLKVILNKMKMYLKQKQLLKEYNILKNKLEILELE